MDVPQDKRKTFSVTIETNAVVSLMVEVTAVDAEAAQDIAFELARRSKDYEWQIDTLDSKLIHTRRIKNIS